MNCAAEEEGMKGWRFRKLTNTVSLLSSGSGAVRFSAAPGAGGLEDDTYERVVGL